MGDPRAPRRPDPGGLPGRRREGLRAGPRHPRRGRSPRPRRRVAVPPGLPVAHARRSAGDHHRVLSARGAGAGPSSPGDARGHRRGSPSEPPDRPSPAGPSGPAPADHRPRGRRPVRPRPPPGRGTLRRQPAPCRGGPGRPPRALGRLAHRAAGADGRGQSGPEDARMSPRPAHPGRRGRAAGALRAGSGRRGV